MIATRTPRPGTAARPRASLAGRLLLGLLLALTVGCKPEQPLPSFGAAPTFNLRDQADRPFGTADLGGRVALADFVYTSCTDTCPLLSANMRRVQDQLKGDGLLESKVVLLSFSLDPERDSPAVLAAYGERFGADPAGWKLLTGPAEEIGQLAQDFKLGRPIPMPPDARNPLVNLAHSNRFVLIDGAGQVRGYYPGESLEVQDVVRDIRRLVR